MIVFRNHRLYLAEFFKSAWAPFHDDTGYLGRSFFRIHGAKLQHLIQPCIRGSVELCHSKQGSQRDRPWGRFSVCTTLHYALGRISLPATLDPSTSQCTGWVGSGVPPAYNSFWTIYFPVWRIRRRLCFCTPQWRNCYWSCISMNTDHFCMALLTQIPLWDHTQTTVS